MNALAWVGIAALVLWVLGFTVFHIAGAAIHLLLALGALMLIAWAVRKFVVKEPHVTA